MDVMLHKRCAKFIYVIPEGLRELMSDISREVIRSQPKHIYTFIADYLDALMITRENARVAARLVDSIVRIAVTTVELLEETGMSREEADRMASIIQSAFKQYMAARRTSSPPYSEVTSDLEEEQDMISNILDEFGDIEQEAAAAEIIQKAFKMFKERQRQENYLLTGMIDWRIAARSAIYLYRKTGATNEEANRAATLIKAAYKGYYTRRIMKRLLDEGSLLYDEDENYQGEEMVENEEEADSGPTDAPQPRSWRDYLDLFEPTTPVSDNELTSTEVAESVLSSVLDMIPSETEPDQNTTITDDWTEGLETEHRLLEGLECGVGEYLGMPEETFETYISPLEKTSEKPPPVEVKTDPVSRDSQGDGPITDTTGEGIPDQTDTTEKSEFVEGSGPDVTGATTDEDTEAITDTEEEAEG